MSRRAEQWLTGVSLALGVLNLAILAATVGRSAYQKLVRQAWIDSLTGGVRPEVKRDADRFMEEHAKERGAFWTPHELARAAFVELGRTRPGPADVPEINAIVFPELKSIARRHLNSGQA